MMVKCANRVFRCFRCLQKDIYFFQFFFLIGLKTILLEEKYVIALALRPVYVKYHSCHYIKKNAMDFILIKAPITIKKNRIRLRRNCSIDL